jgi:hypothetical protein
MDAFHIFIDKRIYFPGQTVSVRSRARRYDMFSLIIFCTL